MKIFLGSSREALGRLRQVASWLEEAGHDPVAWDDPELFLPGENTFEKLIQISRDVDAAVFVFAEDDAVWYRRDALAQPRDNVLVEYGLFAGARGQRHVVICRSGQAKMPTDAGGITYVDLDLSHRARLSILAWARSVSAPPAESTGSRGPSFAIEQALLRRELAETRERLAFEEQKARDLQRLTTRFGIVDFRSYEGVEGAWKLLFDYEYFWSLARIVEETVGGPNGLRMYLDDVGLAQIAADVSWSQATNLARTRFYVAKVLRLVRTASVADGTAALEALLNAGDGWPVLSDRAGELARARSQELVAAMGATG
jgi:Predicted nucleotide-binding protein containing TIR-like domain